LTVSKAGTGSGSVTSSPAGIDCGTTCSASYPEGTAVSMTATPASGSVFGGWSGACTGTGSCTVTMSEARTLTATFSPASVTTTRIEETSSAVRYTGTFHSQSNTADSAGAMRYSGATGGAAEFTFTGTGIRWLSRYGATSGIDQVYLDGVLVATVDRYSPTNIHQKVAYEKLDLPAGTHTIRIVRTGNKNPSASNSYLILDAFETTQSS